MLLNKRCKFLTDFFFREPTSDTWNWNSPWRSWPPNSESWQNAGHFERMRLRVLFFEFNVSWALKIFLIEYNNKYRTFELPSFLHHKWKKTKSKEIKSFFYEKHFLHCSDLTLLFPQQTRTLEISDQKPTFFSHISTFCYKLYPPKIHLLISLFQRAF